MIALEEQNLSDFLEIRSYLTGELGADELNTILMEARAAAAAAAAQHLQHEQSSDSKAKVELESNGNTHFHQTDVHDALSESGNINEMTFTDLSCSGASPSEYSSN